MTLSTTTRHRTLGGTTERPRAGQLLIAMFIGGCSASPTTSPAPAPSPSATNGFVNTTATPAVPASNNPGLAFSTTGATTSPEETAPGKTTTDASMSAPTTGTESAMLETSTSMDPDSAGPTSTTSVDVSSAERSSSSDAPALTKSPLADAYPCESAEPTAYDVAVIKDGTTWNVTKAGQSSYSGTDFEQALTRAYGALSPNRTTKESILVRGDGDIPATSQVRLPSFTILNICGTVNVTGAPSGSDRSPFYARGASQIEIPNLKLAGSPQYGLFFRETNDIHLGLIELRLTRQAGIGVRIDSGPDAGSTTEFNENLQIDYIYGTGMGSHVVETYGIAHIEIGSVEGEDVGECGLLLNRSIHAEIGSVSCTNCASDTGYAAFRVANSAGKVGSDFPDGNVHVGKVTARGGGRGIFSVSGCGGLTIDEIDIAETGNTSILLQNTYNTVIAAKSGTVSGGLVQLTNDTDNTNEGVYPPSKDVILQNLTLSNGASVRQDWCSEFGSNGCSANNISGGNVSMCP